MAVTQKEWSLAEAKAIASNLLESLEGCFERVELAGSVRRQRPLVHDIDFVATPVTYSVRLDLFGQVEEKRMMLDARLVALGIDWTGGDKIHRFDYQDADVDVYLVDPANFALTWLIRTGSMEHNQFLCQLANGKGLSISYSQGLKELSSGKVLAIHSEQELFELLGLAYVEPEQREAVRCSGYPSFRPIWRL